MVYYPSTSFRIYASVLLLWVGLASSSAIADERTEFRDFVGQIFGCVSERAQGSPADCLRQTILGQPRAPTWISDPDRLELLFQASGMDGEAKQISDLARALLLEHGRNVFQQVQPYAVVGQAVSSMPAQAYVEAIKNLPPDVFSQMESRLRSALEQFRPSDLGGFSSLFRSVEELASGGSTRASDFTRAVVRDYLDSLTVVEKARIVADYFRTPLASDAASKLRPLLQNVDPIMQKIFQLLGQLIASPEIRDAVAVLQSSIDPFPFEQMTERFKSRTGKEFSAVFADYDPSTMRRATTGQVVFATLRESGERVAVKVRIPGLRTTFENSRRRMLRLPSVAASAGLSTFLKGILDGIAEEIDYRNEAEYTDLAQRFYQSPSHGISSLRRISSFEPYEDLVIYGYAAGVKPTQLVAGSQLELRAARMRGLVELWTETVFFKNIESEDLRYRHTTLFHGDLHPGNILIDPTTGTMTLLDFGNVGFFPLAERRIYLDLYLSALEPTPRRLVEATLKMYESPDVAQSARSQISEIAQGVWKDGGAKSERLDLFLVEASDKVGLPMRKSISSFTRGMAFLRVEAETIDQLLAQSDPRGAVPRVSFDETMRRTLIGGFKRELFSLRADQAQPKLADSEFLKRATAVYMRSIFVEPCLGLFRKMRR